MSSEKLILCFDTETTGLPINGIYEHIKLIELGCILFKIDGTVIERYNSLTDYIMTDTEIEKTGHIHNITNEMIEKEGKPVIEVLNKFKELYNKADYILAHNINYDINILLNEFNKINDDFNIRLIKEKENRLCTATEIHYSLNNIQKRQKRIRLVNLFALCYPNETYEAHRALNDCEVTMNCFLKQLK